MISYQLSPEAWKQIIFVGKAVGAIATLAGVSFALIRKPASAIINFFKRLSVTSNHVNLLMTNHLPHISSTLDAHGEALLVIKSDVRNVNTRMDGFGVRLDGV